MKTTEFIEKLHQTPFISGVEDQQPLKQVSIFVHHKLVATISTKVRFAFNLMEATFSQLPEGAQTILYILLTEYAATPLNERANSRARLDAMEDELEELLAISDGRVAMTYSKIHDGTIFLYLEDTTTMLYVDKDVITFPSTDREEPSISIDRLLTVISYVKDHLDELHELWELTRKHDHRDTQEYKSGTDGELVDEWKTLAKR